MHAVKADRETHSDSIASHNEISGIPYPDVDSHMDSLIRALYPEVRECRYTGSMNEEDLSIKVTSGQNSPSGREGIFNTAVPDIVAIDRSKAVGEIEIRSAVTPTGAKTYEVPIKVYPGINGFQPTISLSYNSQLGSSPVGQGWSLSGIPVITRGCKNPYYDNKSEGVRMDLSDSFYLDGMRLLQTRGPGSGAPMYKSEFGNIIARGKISGNVLLYFEVFYPDGTKAIFGYKDNTDNDVFYPVTEMSDMYGNTIRYSYLHEDNYHLISRIDYGNAHIAFKYGWRADGQDFYIGGEHIFIDSTLHGITCCRGDLELHSYELSYETHHDVTVLKQIGYNNGNNGYNPLTFYYGEGNTEQDYNTSVTRLLRYYESDDPQMVKVVRGRFANNTADEGLIIVPNYNPYWHHYVNKSSDGREENGFRNLYSGNENIFLYTGLSGSFAEPEPELLTEAGFVDILCADLKGNQEDCIVKINNGITTMGEEVLKFKVYVYRPESIPCFPMISEYNIKLGTQYRDEAAKGSSAQPKFYYAGDFNGDGKMEILAVSAHNPWGKEGRPTKCYLFDLENNTTLYEGHEFAYNVTFVGSQVTDEDYAANNSDRLLVFDADGDGKTDICLVNESGTHIYTFTKATSGELQLKKLGTSTIPHRSMLADKDLIPGEFNGDGLTDLLETPGPGLIGYMDIWNKYYSMGDGTFQYESMRGSNNEYQKTGFLCHDINGDGISDIIKYDSSGFDTYPSNPHSIDHNGFHTAFAPGNPILVPTDINSHNTFCQLLSLNKGTVTKYASTMDKRRELLMTGMSTSLGAIERNEYSSLSNGNDGGVYAYNGGAAFPYVNLREPVMVLARTETWCGNALCGSSRYRYENAVFHRQGLGFCGFDRIDSFDSHENRTVQIYNPGRRGVLVSSFSPECEITNNITIKTASDKTKQILVDGKTEKNLLTGLVSDYSYTYDEYGYPLTENISHSDGIKIENTTSYLYQTDIKDTYSLGFAITQTKKTARGEDTYVEMLDYPGHHNRRPITSRQYVNGNQTGHVFYVYDSHGNVLEEHAEPYESGTSLLTAYSYDEEGRLTDKTDPWGCTESYSYDAYGRLTGITDHTGTTAIGYDALGNETSRTYPDGTADNITYSWSSGNSGAVYEIETKSTGKPVVTKSYDALGRLVRESDTRFDGRIRKTDREYDIHGNLTRVSEPYFGAEPSAWTEYGYDIHGRLDYVDEPSGRWTGYGYSGMSVTTLENNIEIRRTYDSLGNLVKSTDEAGSVEYDLAADGQPVKVTCPGGIIYWYYYDGYRRQETVVDASAGIIRYEYDRWGNMSRRSPPGQEIAYLYDDLNRLEKVVTAGLTTSYSYDELNRLVSVHSDNGTSRTVTYDAYGRLLTSIDNVVDGKWLQRKFHYSAGNISAVEYSSQSGMSVTENYVYSNGTFSEGKIGDTVIFRLEKEDEYGNPVEIQTGDITRSYSRSFGVPVSQKAYTGNGDVIQNLDYSFDPESLNLMRRTDAVTGVDDVFQYDGLNRLTAHNSQEVSYNTWGNITEKQDVGSFAYEIYNKPHAVTKIVTNGNSIPLHTQEISYTTFSRPAAISENGVKASFAYNGYFDRVRMDVRRGDSCILTRYYLGDNYEFDETDVVSREKLYLFGDYYDSTAVLVREGGSENIHYILRDHLGSVTELTDASGEIEQKLSFDAWGIPRDPDSGEYYGATEDGPEMLLGRGYTGHEHLPWFGLVNMNARLYDPLTSRFLSPDPYVQLPDFTQGLNRFSYALNNPLCYVDQDGEFFWLVVGAAAVIGGTVNVITHWDTIKSGGFWTGAAYFMTGAAAGGIGAAVGIGTAVGFGGMLGVTSASYAAATSGFLHGAFAEAAAGAASGFILDTANSLIDGENLGNSLLNGLAGAGWGGLSGALSGGLTSGFQSMALGDNFWTGAKPLHRSFMPAASGSQLLEPVVKTKNHYCVYFGYDTEGKVRYVGITGRDPEIRFAEHKRSKSPRASLDFEVVDGYTGLSHLGARIQEQIFINQYGFGKYGGDLLNKRNEIAPKFWSKYGIMESIYKKK